MQVSLENTASLERRMTVSLPAERLDGVVGNRLREIARTTNLKGFRRGKVPTKIIEQRYGAQVRSEAFGELVRETFDEALRKENIKPAGTPSIEAQSPGENGEIRYTATFEVVPDFGIIDVASLKIDRVSATVQDADIDAMIDTLQQQRRNWNPVDRAAKAGDLVRIETHADVGGTRIPAEGVEQGATVLGSHTMFPALEGQLVGFAADEERAVEVAFPADWRVPEMAGKTANIQVKALQVSEPVVPAVD